MHICIITDNPSAYSAKRFLGEALFAGHKITFAPWSEIVFNGGKNTISINQKILLDSYDAIILRSSVRSLTPLSLVVEYCKAKNIPLLNNQLYMRLQNTNKLRQQILFQIENIPCLETLYGENLTFLELKKRLRLPFIAKIADGSLGKQVFKIHSQEEFSQFTLARKKDRRLYLFQKYYKISRDYRVFIIGKEIFGAVQRIAPQGEWRTNMRGAKHMRATGSLKITRLAKLIRKKLNIDFAGIDILIDTSGHARLIEINTMAQFKVFENTFPEINIAKKTFAVLANKKTAPHQPKRHILIGKSTSLV